MKAGGNSRIGGSLLPEFFFMAAAVLFPGGVPTRKKIRAFSSESQLRT